MLSIPSTPPSAQYPPHPSLSTQPPHLGRYGVPAAPLLVVISLDVEEEGLFSGHYRSSDCTVRNVQLLRRLEPLSRELGFPLTLLCAHTVFTNGPACEVLEYMRQTAGAEIGAHLHHWSTPPLLESPPALQTESQSDPLPRVKKAEGPPTRAHRLDRDLLRQRLHTLLEAGRAFQGKPLTSFRMGRWDLKASVRPLLAEQGILVDSSVCPLRAFDAGKDGQVADGPDHFLAPADPYWIPSSPTSGTLPTASPVSLLEAPITQVPWHPWLARAWYAFTAGKAALDQFKFWGALSPNPVWHAEQVMRMATRLHVARGGRVLSLFWHSSEMLPGASPNIPDQKAADALLVKVRRYLLWLRAHYAVRGVTLSELHGEAGFPVLADHERQGDW